MLWIWHLAPQNVGLNSEKKRHIDNFFIVRSTDTIDPSLTYFLTDAAGFLKQKLHFISIGEAKFI